MQKIIWIETLRVICTFLVVVLHVSSMYTNIFYQEWQIANMVNTLTRFAVPCFLMITGFLLLGKPIDIKEFFKKRFSRIVIPFVVWGIIYIILKLGRTYYYNHNSVDSLISMGMNLLYNGPTFHLWYIYMLIGLYLFIPIINVFICNASKNLIVYFLLFWAISLLIQPILIRENIDFKLTYFSGYIGYLILGYYLVRYDIKIKTLYLIGVFVISFSFTAIVTCYTTIQVQKFTANLYEPLSLNIAILSISAFLLAKRLLNIDKIKNIFFHLGKYSYGIFLAHVFVLGRLIDFGLSSNLAPIYSMIVLSLLCFGISYLLIFLLTRVKMFKRLVN